MSGVDLRKQLYDLLPAVYRERDDNQYNADGELVRPGQMARLLAAYGELLNGLHGTLQQRYYDNFPDLDPELDEHGRERSCQDWLLPYFAQLLDVRLVSPDPNGRRAEVSQAVAWRQRKGTRVAAEQVAEAVAQVEVEIREGWQRVALTPRIGDPLLPASHYGELSAPVKQAAPAERARHPGLPAVTPDLRYASRAVRADADNPAAKRTRFAGESLSWRQAQRHAAPCFHDSFQDTSLRTPDLRTPGAGPGRGLRGAYHPRRVILHYPPPAGYFPDRPASLNWSTAVNGTPLRDLELLLDHPLIEIRSGTTTWHGEEIPFTHYRGLTPTPLRLRGTQVLGERRLYRFDNIWLHNRISMENGVMELRNGAARNLVFATSAQAGPVLLAQAALIQRLVLAAGTAMLEHCTVLLQCIAPALFASDCIFLSRPRRAAGSVDVPEAGCLRFSRYPHTAEADWASNGAPSQLQRVDGSCTHRDPVFYSSRFGEHGCGVLHPGAHPEVRNGAEDGGEMGAYHALRLALREDAVQDKLKDYLPVGMEALLAPDSSLLCAPPEDT